MGKCWWGKNWQIWQIVSYLPKFSSPIFTDTPLAYALTVTYSPNFSSPIAVTSMVHQNFPCQNFPVYGVTIVNSKYQDSTVIKSSISRSATACNVCNYM